MGAGLTVAVALLCAVGAFASTPATAPLMTYITGLATPSPRVWIALAADGGSPTNLGPASSALISPDGGWVAAISIQKQSNASTLSLYRTPSGSATTLIAKRPQFMQLLGWSPNSKLLLVTVGTSPAQLMLVDTTTRQHHVVATGAIYGAGFAPGSSDAIVYARSRLGKTAVNIYITNTAGNSTSQLTSDGRSEYPLWCPSGIIYSRETPRPKNPYPELQLWLMNADGSGSRQLTSLQVSSTLEGLTPVACSHNGQHLLANYVGPPGSNSTEPFTVDLSGHDKPHNLTAAGYIGDSISLDGGTVLITKGTANDLQSLSIETYPWSGGKPTTLVGKGAYPSWNR